MVNEQDFETSFLHVKMDLWLQLFGKVEDLVRSSSVVTFPLQFGYCMMALALALASLFKQVTSRRWRTQNKILKLFLPSWQSSYAFS